MTEQLNSIEHKVDAILHWVQSSSGLMANPFGDPLAMCSLCFEPVTYQPILDGTIKRVCGCRLPIHSLPVDNYKKKEV